ncbi:MAG: ferrochelatase [Cardiobacteriaceae bacterium]|nr:ferrochelatase [Cardiobacteriaceae bacterium]
MFIEMGSVEHFETAVLVVNLGSPDEPTPSALRRYLREFLSDPRVIDLPRWQWLPILHGIVLTFRPRKSAHAYEQVWTEEGSPLIVITEQQTEALQKALWARGKRVLVDYAMRYGNPSIESVLKRLHEKGVKRLLVIPMYPQYSCSTTASIVDGVADALKKQRLIPELRFIRDWYNHSKYHKALARTIREDIEQYGEVDKVLFSYHGVPKRYVETGDPYQEQCEMTTKYVARLMNWREEEYQTIFQSRFGSEEWLQPYADKTIEALPKQGVKRVAVICPGFSADCLETLEEMAEENKALFFENGGEEYRYIPALNAQTDHIELLADLAENHLWQSALP